MRYVGAIMVPVEADSPEEALERLASWAESCVQCVEGEGMNTKQHSVWVEGLWRARNDEEWDGPLTRENAQL